MRIRAADSAVDPSGRVVGGIVERESVPDVFLPPLIELWRQGRFPIDRIMTHYDFDEIDRAARTRSRVESSSRCCRRARPRDGHAVHAH